MKWEVYMDIRAEGAKILGVYMDESVDLGCIWMKVYIVVRS